MSRTVQDAFGVFDDDTGRLVALRQNDRSAPEYLLPSPAAGRGVPIELVNPVAGGANDAGSGNSTWQQVIATRMPAFAVRARYYNGSTSAATFDKTKIYSSSVYAPTGNPDGPGVDITWNGARSCTVAAAPAAGEVTWGPASDLVPISPLAWAAAGAGAPTLWHVRTYIANAPHPFLAVNGGYFPAYPGNKVGGLVRYGTQRGMDWIDIYGPSTNVFDGLSDGLFLPISLEFFTLGKFYRVAVLGDSIANGTVLATGGQLGNFTERACNLANASSSSTRPLCCASNLGIGSQTHAQIYRRLAPALAANPCEVVLLPIFSPNSPCSTQAQADADAGRVLAGIAAVRAAGGVPVLFTGAPGPMSALQDGFRKANNARFIAYGAATGTPVADVDAAVSAGGSPATWKPGYSDDGVHPNDTATQAYAAAVATALLQA